MQQFSKSILKERELHEIRIRICIKFCSLNTKKALMQIPIDKFDLKFWSSLDLKTVQGYLNKKYKS